MTPRSHRVFRLVLAALFLLVGALRLLHYSRSGQAVDVLSGIGFLLLAFGYYREGSLRLAGPGRPASMVGRYALIGGTVLIVAALVSRLVR